MSEALAETFRAAFEGTRDPKVIVDSEGRLVACNPAARDLVGSGRLGEPGDEVLASLFGDEARARSVLSVVLGGSVAMPVALEFDRGGKQVRHTGTCIPLRVCGRPRAVLVEFDEELIEAFRDLSAEVRKSNAHAAYERRMRHELEVAYQSLDRFAGMAAHDLRAPLRQIGMLLEVLTEELELPPSNRAADLIEQALASSQRMKLLVEGLLSFARAGKHALEKRWIDLGEVVDEAAADLADMVEESGAAIRHGDLGQVSADPVLARQLFQNLIENAIKYKSPDRTPVIELQRRDRNGVTEITVSDNGLGLDPGEGQDLLMPFSRGSRTALTEGSGIGLSTCNMICDRHGWSIAIEGRPDRGATVTIRMSEFPDPV